MIGGCIFTIIGVILLIIYIKEKIAAYSVKALILKTSVSVCFSAVAACGVFKAPSLFGACLLAGLFCGLMGDIWLDLKFVYPNDSVPYTFAGFISFAIGHLVFMGGIVKTYYDLSKPMPLVLACILSIVIGIAVVLSGPLMKLNYGRYKLISMIYAPVLVGTSLITLAVCITSGFAYKEMIVMLIGGILFLLSDLVLSGTYFGVGKERPVDIILNYVFYYGAQFVIAWVVIIAA